MKTFKLLFYTLSLMTSVKSKNQNLYTLYVLIFRITTYEFIIEI